jgi:flagellar basal-body rod protein FlgB
MMSKRLVWLGKRQEVIAQNIANSDTPHFKARELKAQSFKEALSAGAPGPVRMVATQVNHMAGQVPAAKSEFKDVPDKDAEVSISGNSVALEDQMMKVAQTAMNHQLTVNLYRKHVAMIKTALGRPGG